VSRANSLPYESEKLWIHEQITGSVAGSSYRREVIVQFHLDGTGEVHESLTERDSCS
jgi:hypothetical protein